VLLESSDYVAVNDLRSFTRHRKTDSQR